MLGGWAQGLLWANVGSFGLLVGAMLVQVSVLARFHAGEATFRDLTNSDALVGLALIIGAPIYLAAIVLFLIWQFHHHRQLAALRGRDALRHSPGFGIGAWFIPAANLVLPLLVIANLWKVSARPGAAGPDRVSPLVWWWWSLFVFVPLAWLVITFFWGFAQGIAGTFDPNAVEPTGMVVLATIAYLSMAVAAGLGARVVAGLTRRTAALSSAAGW